MLKGASVPFAAFGVAAPESVHSIALLPALVPRPFIAMAVAKVINPETMDFVSEILPCVAISIPRPQKGKTTETKDRLFPSQQNMQYNSKNLSKSSKQRTNKARIFKVLKRAVTSKKCSQFINQHKFPGR